MGGSTVCRNSGEDGLDLRRPREKKTEGSTMRGGMVRWAGSWESRQGLMRPKEERGLGSTWWRGLTTPSHLGFFFSVFFFCVGDGT